jgi:SOS-response transcriptional repressor LexA
MSITTSLMLSDILNRLLFQKKLRVAELSRQTGISQPTLQRMVTGTIENPHRSSLVSVANYFHITVEQLKGLQPIPWLHPITSAESGWTTIPLLSWTELIHDLNHININSTKNYEKVMTDAHISSHSFALKVQDASMEPLFSKETTLIIDPKRIPNDRSYIVALLHSYSVVIFRQLIIDGPHRYLKPISPDFDHYKMNMLTDDDKILGVLIQARRNFEE